MAKVLDPKTGQLTEAPDEQVAELVRSGRASFQDERVPVISPDGEPGTLPSTQVRSALADGYRLPTQKERQQATQEKEFGGRPTAAGLAGAGRGFTLGLSDLGLVESGLVDPRTLRGLKEANPGASIGGEALGTAAGMLAGTGEVSAVKGVAKAGVLAEGLIAREAGEGLLRTAGRKALGQAVEGGLYGLGNVVSESALGDPELNAQKAVGMVGVAGLASGALGGLFGAAGHGLGAALKSGAPARAVGALAEKEAPTFLEAAAAQEASPLAAGLKEQAPSLALAAGGEAAGLAGPAAASPASSLREQLKEFAERRAVKAVAGNGHLGALRKLENKGITADVGRFAIDEGILTAGATADDMLARAQASVEKHGARIGEILEQADSKANPMISGEELAKRIKDSVVAPLRRGGVGDNLVADRLAKEAEAIAEKGDIGFTRANELKRSFDKYLDFGVEQKPVQQGLKQIRGIINADIEAKLASVGDSVAPGLGAEFKAAKRSYGLASELEDLASERALQLRNNRSISPSDYGLGGIGAVMAGGPLGVATGVASAVGHKMLRERGPQALAVVLDKLADSGAVSRISKAFAEQLGPKLEQLPELFGPFRSVLAASAARGADDLLATHIALHEADPAYRNQMALAGYPDEGPADAHAAGVRAGQLGAVGEHLDAQDGRTEAAVGRFLGQQGGALPQSPEGHASRSERLKAYKERTQALEALAADPQAMAAKLQVSPALAAAAPALATATMATAANALRFLQDKAPRNPTPELLPALQRPWAPSDAELARWERYVATVDNPQTALADLRRGTLAPESVEALRAVYPKVLEDIQTRMMNRLSGYQGQLSSQQRQALATLFGGPVGMSPSDNTAVYQQAHAVAAIQEAQKQQRARASSASKKSGSSPYATQSQRLEGR